MSNEYATPENDDTDYRGSTHIRGTIPRGTGLEFWLGRPRPRDVSVDEWDKLEEDKWQRIFGNKEAISERG